MTEKQELVIKLRNTLVLSGSFEEDEVRQDRDVLEAKLGNDFYMNPESLELEYECHSAFMRMKRGYETLGSEKAGWIDNLAHMLFTSDGTGPSADDPRTIPPTDTQDDTQEICRANNELLAKEVDSDLNCGEAPTILLSRQEVSVLYVTKRNSPDPQHNLPISWHCPIMGKATIEVVGVQMGDTQVPIETRVIFKGKRVQVQAFRTGLGGTVHGLCIEAVDDEGGKFNSWDLYTDVLTPKGKERGGIGRP